MKRFIILIFCLLFITKSINIDGEISPLSVNLPQIVDKTDLKQITCLARNIYHEARGESFSGKLAVAFVTQNRVEENFAEDICSVVYHKIQERCQFSWYCNPLLKDKRLNNSLYKESFKIAKLFYFNHVIMKDLTHGSTFYHAKSVFPNWKLKKTVVIGQHIFYKGV